MTKTYGWNEIIFLALILGKSLLVIGDDGYIFSIWYKYLASIFFLLNLAIYRSQRTNYPVSQM